MKVMRPLYHFPDRLMFGLFLSLKQSHLNVENPSWIWFKTKVNRHTSLNSNKSHCSKAIWQCLLHCTPASQMDVNLSRSLLSSRFTRRSRSTALPAEIAFCLQSNCVSSVKQSAVKVDRRSGRSNRRRCIFHKPMHEPFAVLFKPFPVLFWYFCFRENNRSVIVYSGISGMKKMWNCFGEAKTIFLLLKMCTLNCVFLSGLGILIWTSTGKGRCFTLVLHWLHHNLQNNRNVFLYM